MSTEAFPPRQLALRKQGALKRVRSEAGTFMEAKLEPDAHCKGSPKQDTHDMHCSLCGVQSVMEESLPAFVRHTSLSSSTQSFDHSVRLSGLLHRVQGAWMIT